MKHKPKKQWWPFNSTSFERTQHYDRRDNPERITKILAHIQTRKEK
jgi:hypothetical protein